MGCVLEIFPCRCCERDFFASVSRDGAGNIAEVWDLPRCEKCGKPCCPRCDYNATVGTENIARLCTACHRYPTCTHEMTSSDRRLFQALAAQGTRVHRIYVSAGGGDESALANVRLYAGGDHALEVWNDRPIYGRNGRSTVEIVEEIIRQALGREIIITADVLSNGVFFHLSHPSPVNLSQPTAL